MQDLAFWVQDLAFWVQYLAFVGTERQAEVSWVPGQPAVALL